MKITGQRVIVLAGVATMAAMGVGGGVAQSGAGPLLLVANQGDHTLSLIDPVAGRQIAAVPVGGVTGHEVERRRMGGLRTCRSTATPA